MIEQEEKLGDNLMMTNNSRYLLAFLMLASHPLTAESIKLPHIQSFENRIKSKSSFEFKVEEGHHFNKQSPLGCGTGSTTTVESGKIKCSYKKDGEYKAFLAVCDDEGKFCKIFRPTLYVGKAAPSKKGNLAKNISTSTHQGFKIGNPEALLETALKANEKAKNPKAILLDFFALWCPPCNDLDEMIFPTAAFIGETKNTEKIKINVDEEESWNLKEKFKVLGYPTLVYLNPKGEEVGRFWGTQSPEVLVTWLQKMKKLENMPISWAATQSDEENIKRVVEWNYDLSNYEQVRTLTGARSEEWAKKYFLKAEIALAENAKDKKATVNHFSKLLKLFPNDIAYAYWVLDLSKHDKKLASKNLALAISNTDAWIAKPQEALKENISPQDLIILKADLYETFEKKDELKKAQLEAISFFEKELSANKKVSRGRSHILAYYYREVGRVEDAKAIYESLVKENPQEFTFYFRYARALKDLKEYDKALIWLEKSAPYMTEGNSRYQYSWLKGQILNEVGKKAEALQIVDGTLAIAKAPQWEKDSANRWIRDLTTLKKEIEAPSEKTKK